MKHAHVKRLGDKKEEDILYDCLVGGGDVVPAHCHDIRAVSDDVRHRRHGAVDS